MKFPLSYKCLPKNEYVDFRYKLSPIRYEDRNDIMIWRNSQIDFLRQKEPLTISQQNTYFEKVVSSLFHSDNPQQLLFSFFEDNLLIGYGGLVHINWKDKNAEISFLLDDKRNDEKNYLFLFNIFLKLIRQVSLNLNLHKIYSYGYDICDYRFEPLIVNSFKNEVILKKHICINGKICDVKIYATILNS